VLNAEERTSQMDRKRVKTNSIHTAPLGVVYCFNSFYHNQGGFEKIMEINIKQASMEKTEERGYLGKVQFEVKDHKQAYEIVLHKSKKAKEWGYALNFLNTSGPNEEIDALDEFLDEDDNAFDQLVQAAINAEQTE
jgi:hypothetical protein